MKEDNSKVVSTGSKGLGFSGALTITFIILKLLDKIQWSWFWVLSPLWITFALGLSIFIFVLIIILIIALITK